jgi:hypothetical protein
MPIKYHAAVYLFVYLRTLYLPYLGCVFLEKKATQTQRIFKNVVFIALDKGTDIPAYDGQLVQYVADNINHNTHTLDGNNIFHGMGMITTVTPGTKQARYVPSRTVKPGKIS